MRISSYQWKHLGSLEGKPRVKLRVDMVEGKQNLLFLKVICLTLLDTLAVLKKRAAVKKKLSFRSNGKMVFFFAANTVVLNIVLKLFWLPLQTSAGLNPY